MQGIWVFGDSYAAADNRLDWPFKVGQSLGLPVHNFAVSGGSTEYAIRTFFNKCQSIPNNDPVIFVASTVGRMHLEFQNQHPGTSCWGYQSEIYTNNHTAHQWFIANRDHIRWHMTNTDLGLAHITHLGYKALLKNFAESRPGLVLFLENSDIKGPAEIVNTPSNFINPEIFLCPISEHEIIGRLSYNEWTKYTTYDPRINHLTEPNLETLARLVTNVISTPTTANITAFHYEQFQRDIIQVITSHEDFILCVQNGYINPAANVPFAGPRHG